LPRAFGAFYISTDYKDIIAFVLLVVILSVRPQGLFAEGSPLMKFSFHQDGLAAAAGAGRWPSLPRAGNDYHLTVMSTAYIYAIATIGLNLITGYTGQFNLAHSGFMAVGAYTVGILTVDHQVPFWIAFALAGVVPPPSASSSAWCRCG
jgi:branched-subunit amino acid ABC-type transport system permease component